MSLTFVDASTDNVNCGNPVAFQDIQEGTILVRAFPTSVGNSNKVFAGKCNATGTSGWAGLKFVTDGTKLLIVVNRATGDLSHTTLANTLVASTWYRLGVTWSVSGSAITVWAGGSTGSPMVNVSSGNVAGSGAYVTDTSDDFCIGNSDAGSLGWPGHIDCVAFFGSVLSEANINSWHGRPRKVVNGLAALGFWRLGWPQVGVGTQVDEVGNGNGTITGATLGPECPIGFVARASGGGRAGERHSVYVG